ncbi:lipase family protein [Nitzschia inconspicua]|uniref:Lipase family protein n=1 Tax=Nitzschia inconspicua TaxID=303405 RepID=A0A9K3PFV4_9STRA|nr:lipase family protein [Nitzschia inconspicua]
MGTRNATKKPITDPKREGLLTSSSAAQHQEQCGVELSTTMASSSVDGMTQITTTIKEQADRTTLARDTAGFYLPLTSHADDNPTVTVYDEVKEMLLSAVLTYGVVHLRKLASNKPRNNKKDTMETENDKRSRMMSTILAEHLLTLPISAKEVVRLVSKYRDDIVAEVGKEATVDLYLTAFDDIQSSESSRELELELNSVTSQVSLVSFDIMVVGDERADNDLVYAICVDTSRRRITVSFRGCSCRKDWLVCCQTYLKELDNPLFQNTNSSSQQSNQRCHNSSISSSRKQPPKIAIHSGYYKYLFAPREEDDGKTKFDSIMGHLNMLLQQYPGYSVYVTGHSLGAALATVFSFHAAASGVLKPANDSYESPTVTCINFASPMVGNIDFEKAFRELEDRGTIRCLRVTNYYDIFTQLPDRGNWLYLLVFMPCVGFHLLAYFGVSLLFFMCFQTNVYRHVGMNLHMYRGHKCWTSWLAIRRRRKGMDLSEAEREDNEFRYWYKVKHSHGTADNFAWRVVQDFKKHMKQLIQRMLALPLLTNFDANHRAHEHLRRIKGLEWELKQIQMKDLYGLRTPPSSPDRIAAHIPTNLCLV